MGLKYMFTMMNNARLGVGVEGVAISENSYQKALEFAQERQQMGRPISEFPDVQRMLLTIKAQTEAMRALSYYIAKSMDLAKHTDDEATKKQHQTIVNLLIPVLKSHATDIGVDMSSMALQVFGGVGYVEETGIAQNLRDSRIAPIYEGTNGIQAMDLVMRKITQENALAALSFDIQKICLGGNYNDEMLDAFSKLDGATKYLIELTRQDPEKAQFIAAYYLRMFGVIMGAAMMAACSKALVNDKSDYTKTKKESIAFYMNYILPEIDYLTRVMV